MTLILNYKKIHKIIIGVLCFFIGLLLSLPFFFPRYTLLGSNPLPRFTANPSYIVIHNLTIVKDGKPATVLIRLRDNAPHIVTGDLVASMDTTGEQVALYDKTSLVFINKGGVKTITLRKDAEHISNVLFSPDGKYISVTSIVNSNTNICTVKVVDINAEKPICNTIYIPDLSPPIMWHPGLDHTLLVKMDDAKITASTLGDKTPLNLTPENPKLGYGSVNNLFTSAEGTAPVLSSRHELFYGEFYVATTFNGIEITDRRTFEKSFVSFSSIGVTANPWQLPHVSVP